MNFTVEHVEHSNSRLARKELCFALPIVAKTNALGKFHLKLFQQFQLEMKYVVVIMAKNMLIIQTQPITTTPLPSENLTTRC